MGGVVSPFWQSPARAAPIESVAETFDDGAASWTPSKGTVTPSTSDDVTQGISSLALAYDLTAGSVEVSRPASATPFEAKAYHALKLDYKGDGTYNTLYLRLRDSTGEVLYYRVGNLNVKSWSTATVNLRAAAAAATGGNSNGILDAPLSLYRFVVVRNGTQPATGAVTIDNLRVVGEDWTPAVADPDYFAPALGESASITFTAGTSGDYAVRLSDSNGHTREVIGAASEAGLQTVGWNGRADDGTEFVGDVGAVLSYDSVPDGVVASPTVVGTPLLVTVAEADPQGASTVSLAEGFEGGSEAWWAAKGTVVPSTSGDKTEGLTSLELAYDLSGGAAEAGWSTSPPLLPPTAYSALRLDYKGDGTFNTLYLRLRDATGEILYYRVGNLNSRTWTTATVNLQTPAAATSDGNADNVLDAPISLYRFVVVRNGSEPAAGSVLLDNLRTVGDGWGVPTAAPSYFSLESSEPATITVPAATAGDFEVTVKDSHGHRRALTGSSDGVSDATVSWDGKADDGAAFLGDISAALAYDTIPDGSVVTPTQIGTPLLMTVAELVASSQLAESFDDGAASWVPALGSVTPGDSADLTQGTGALDIDYNLAGGSAEIGRQFTPLTWAPKAYGALKLDYKGDGTFNTLYLRIQDSTGEILYYRVGNISNTTWTTATVDLKSAPTAASGGNGDGVLDAPVALYRLAIVRNGSQAATGKVIVDNLRTVGDGWALPSSQPKYFSAAAGQTTTISIPAATPGDFRLTLKDSAGSSRTFDGTVSAATTTTVAWDGKTADGKLFQGNVSARLDYDTTADGVLTSATNTGVPYFAGVTARTSVAASSANLGVNSSMTTYGSIASADAEAKLMEDAYVHYAREEFEWNRIEPRRGYFEWAKFDQAVAVAKGRNVEIVGKLVYTADWASSAPAGTDASTIRYYAPQSTADWENYVARTVERYKDSVTVWEVWNEPNLDKYWMPAPDASQYAALLTASYQTIKSIQPNSTVLIGGLANGFPESFVNSVINSGAANSFDGVAMHMYVAGAPEPSIIDTWISTAETFMARKLPGRTLWITEIGWTSCGSCATKVTEEQQAQYLSRLMIDTATHGIRGVMWFNLRETGTSTSSIDNYGLVERTGRLKPAYTALSRFGAATVQTVSSGTVNPSSSGTSTLLNDFATTTGMRASSLGTGGSTTIAVSSGRLGGAGAVSVKYNYSASTATGGQLTLNTPVPGSPTALSVWAYGDNSNTVAMLKFADATGETFEAKIGNIGTAKWSRLVFYLDGMNPNYSHAGGNNDGVVNYPISVKDMHFYRSSGSGLPSGQFILDDLTAHYGVATRGGVFIGRGYVTQAVYAIIARDGKLSVPNSTAYVYDRGSVTGLTVTSAQASVTISPTPKFVISAPAVTPVIGPTNSPVALSLIAGDRSVLTVQIYTSAGTLIRTLATNQAYVSGPRVITWDGRKSNGDWAVAGAYVLRIQTMGSDTRSSVVSRYFTLN
ncbi:FlgD immunoglobulin-like domain containing protein [Herbiconiux sp. VKM Ac-2851]|uniref:FlgD immunoglobulin-like domain containing protein n=1 Tax=Herbiconiux sp. VKM Ac-2851 TaxID=2739025 RepID=UPI00156450C3|nr:endo-1,4-beta-xylanase [Herbiconiux sp. VKM Ac-2851]